MKLRNAEIDAKEVSCMSRRKYFIDAIIMYVQIAIYFYLSQNIDAGTLFEDLSKIVIQIKNNIKEM